MNLPPTLTKRLETWLKTCRHKDPPAIILGGSVNGLTFARSLGRRGIPTLLLENDRFLGIFTRFGEVVLLPPAGEHPQRWIALLEFVGSRLDTRPVLVPTSDALTLFVSQHRDMLERYFRFLIPNAEAIGQIVDKRSQYSVARAAGIPVPKSYFPDSADDVQRLSHGLVYPCLLKPCKSYIGRKRLSNKKVQVVASPKELVSAYNRLTVDNVPFLIQEIIPGEDDALYGYLGFWDAEGNERAWLTKKKLRQFPPYYGDGSLQMTLEAPEVAELSRRLLRAFNYRGLVNIEFKYDARDGAYRLMEVNPRSAASTQISISAGVDMPWIYYRHLTVLDEGATQAERFKPLIKCVNEEWEVQAYLAYRKLGGLNLWSWLRSLYGSKITIMAWDDPMPFIVGLWRLVALLWSRLRRDE